MSRLTEYIDAVFQQPPPPPSGATGNILSGGSSGGSILLGTGSTSGTWRVPSGKWQGATWSDLMGYLKSGALSVSELQNIITEFRPTLGQGVIEADIKANTPSPFDRGTLYERSPELTEFSDNELFTQSGLSAQAIADELTKRGNTLETIQGMFEAKGFAGTVSRGPGGDIVVSDSTFFVPGTQIRMDEAIAALEAAGYGPNLTEAEIKNRAIDQNTPDDAWMALQVYYGYSDTEATSAMQGINEYTTNWQPGTQQQATPEAAGASTEAVPSWLSAPVTQGYGPTTEGLDSPYAGAAHFNKGYDFGVSEGTPIEALVGGTVVSAGDAGDGWGISVKVKDTQGNTHNYGHLSGVNVNPGDVIQPGQLVGASGNTGASTGPHLSYDVMNANGEWIDPTSIIETAKAGGAGAQAPGYTFSPEVEQWRGLVSKYFPAEEVNKVLYLINRESGGDPTAHNPVYPDDSYGLLQINQLAHAANISAEQSMDPEQNIAYAAKLWADQGYGPWATGPGQVYGDFPEEILAASGGAQAGFGQEPSQGFGVGASDFGQGRLTARQQLERDLNNAFQAGTMTEEQVAAQLAAFDASESAKTYDLSVNQADAALEAYASSLGVRMFKMGPGEGFYYDLLGRQVPVSYVASRGRVEAGTPLSANQVVTGPGGFNQIVSPARSDQIRQAVEEQGAFPFSPEQAAVTGFLGPVQGAEYLQETGNLPYKPSFTDINQLLGTSIGGRNTAVDPRTGSRLTPEDLLAIASGPRVNWAGGSTMEVERARLADMATRVYPNDPMRQQQYIETNLAETNLARTLDTGLTGINRQLNQYGQPVVPATSTFTRTIGGETEEITQDVSEPVGLENLDVYQAGTGTNQVVQMNDGLWYVVDAEGRILYGPFTTQARAAPFAGVAGYHQYQAGAEQKAARLAGDFTGGVGTPGSYTQATPSVAQNRTSLAALSAPRTVQPSRSSVGGLPSGEGMQRPPGQWGRPRPQPEPPVVQPPLPPPRYNGPIIYQNQGGVNFAGGGGVSLNGMNGFNTPEELLMVGAQSGRIYSAAGEGPDGLGGVSVPEQITVTPQNPLAALARAKYPVQYQLIA